MPEAGRSERPEGEGGEPPKLAALEGASGMPNIVPREELARAAAWAASPQICAGRITAHRRSGLNSAPLPWNCARIWTGSS
jgi:hypothetical protein